MNSITMMLENVQVDVYYTSTICTNSNGVGGGDTCEVDIDSIDVGGVDVLEIMDENLVQRVIDHIVKMETSNEHQRTQNPHIPQTANWNNPS